MSLIRDIVPKFRTTKGPEHSPNLNYNLMGFDTIEINLFLHKKSLIVQLYIYLTNNDNINT